MTTCVRVQNEAGIALFEGSPLPSLVSSHAAACEACRHEISELTLLFTAMGATPTLVAMPHKNFALTAAVVADVAARKRTANVLARVIRPFTFAGAALAFVLFSGGALIVGAWVNTQPHPTQSVEVTTSTTPPATTAPATTTPATPGASEAPASAAPTPTPAPTDLPRRTPEPASPTPSGDPSTAAPGSTSP